jgi:hypothetical protein
MATLGSKFDLEACEGLDFFIVTTYLAILAYFVSAVALGASPKPIPPAHAAKKMAPKVGHASSVRPKPASSAKPVPSAKHVRPSQMRFPPVPKPSPHPKRKHGIAVKGKEGGKISLDPTTKVTVPAAKTSVPVAKPAGKAAVKKPTGVSKPGASGVKK